MAKYVWIMKGSPWREGFHIRPVDWPRKTGTTECCSCEVCDGAKLLAGFQGHHSQASFSCARDCKELISPNWQTVTLIAMTNLRIAQGLQFGSLAGNDSSAPLGGFPVTRHLLQNASHLFLVSRGNLGQNHHQVHATSTQTCAKPTSICYAPFSM